MRPSSLLQLPITLLSRSAGGAAALAAEGVGAARNIVILSESFLSWVTALAVLAGSEISAGHDEDPFASPWDTVIRSPRPQYEGTGMPGHHRPAA